LRAALHVHTGRGVRFTTIVLLFSLAACGQLSRPTKMAVTGAAMVAGAAIAYASRPPPIEERAWNEEPSYDSLDEGWDGFLPFMLGVSLLVNGSLGFLVAVAQPDPSPPVPVTPPPPHAAPAAYAPSEAVQNLAVQARLLAFRGNCRAALDVIIKIKALDPKYVTEVLARERAFRDCRVLSGG